MRPRGVGGAAVPAAVGGGDERTCRRARLSASPVRPIRASPTRLRSCAALRETIIRSQDDVALAQAGGLGEPGLTCAIFAASPRMRIVEAWARAG